MSSCLPRCVAVGVVLLALCSTTAYAAPAGWNYTWGDEFNANSIDGSKWDRINWNTPHNNELQAYHHSRTSASGGNLVLRADAQDFGGKLYTSGKVESKFAQQHGRWEVRAKLPGTLGTWPAIWLLPATQTYPWPSQGEIDFMENRGSQPHLVSSALHWGPNFEGRQFTYDEHVSSTAGQADNFHDEFHIYTVEWDASKIRFFVDDVHYHTITNAETANSFYPNGFLAQQTAPMELNLNVAVGGDFLGGAQPDDNISVWPQEMLIDYVRVYERDTSPPPVVFQNGSFEQNGGSLASWGMFGNSGSNIQAHHEATAIDGNETLKLYGQFTGAQNYSGIEQGISVSPGDSLAAEASAFIRSEDDIVGGNAVLMKFDYYSDFGGKFGSSDYLGSSSDILMANADSATDVWTPHSLTDTAPAGAVEARLVFVFSQPLYDGGAIHIDDVSFVNLDLEFNADANGDGDVDGVDFLSLQRGFGLDDGTSVADGDFNYDGVVDADDLNIWRSSQSPQSLSSASAVPEPTGCALVVLAVMSCLKSRIR